MQQLEKYAYAHREILNSKYIKVVLQQARKMLSYTEVISRSWYWIYLNRSFVQICLTENTEIKLLGWEYILLNSTETLL